MGGLLFWLDPGVPSWPSISLTKSSFLAMLSCFSLSMVGTKVASAAAGLVLTGRYKDRALLFLSVHISPPKDSGNDWLSLD